MPSVLAVLRFIAVLAVVLALAGCKTAEERAEEHFQSGMALLQAGDPDRAIVEFRNVFQLNGSHQEARRALAGIFRDKGDLQEAYGQYLRLVEQYPDDTEGRIALSEIAFQVREWEELDRHGAEAERLAPEDPRVRVIALARSYRAAVLAEDSVALERLRGEAETLIAAQPDHSIIRHILVDSSARAGDYDKALEALDFLIAADPENRDYRMQRLALLAQNEDEAGIEAQLVEMVELFPEDTSIKASLIRFYMSRGAMDKAEAFLREISDPAAEDPGAFVDLVRFLVEVRGPEAARAELDRGIAVSPDPAPLRAIRAGLDFAEGRQDAAVAELEAVLAEAEPSEQTRNIKVALAQMLLATGNEVGARRLVEEVLAEDPAQAEALKIRAAWQIAADDTDGAIASLRAALDKAPEDAAAMTLMAEAHTRAGNHSLARDFLALAVEASGNAPDQTIRYARLLIGEERYLPAEDILLPALRLAPGDVGLLVTLGQLYLAMEDSARAQQVIDALRRLEDPAAVQAANGLEAERLNREEGTGQAVAFLESLADGADADLDAKLALLRARLVTGDTGAALAFANELSAAEPGDERIRFALAATQAAAGELAPAAENYRALLAADPARPAVWLELSRTLQRMGDRAGAVAAIDEGLATVADEPNLLWARATFLEQDGDIDGAIAIYESLYERNSDSVIVANNLASLLATYRDDPESLERAWVVARRLSGTEVPQMQDTYGWILFRRGETEAALPYLEAAAAALAADPVVQYHLGVVHAALGRNDEALAQFRRAVELAGPADTRAQIAAARDEIARLEAAGVTGTVPGTESGDAGGGQSAGQETAEPPAATP